jgi:exopolyphosphatase / guanosine-5'-triphosphate,3'-diphosphate pyrophosphatase
MRIGIIDLGTNTFNLLVAELGTAAKINFLYREKIAVKLGEGGINNDVILPEPFLRGIESLKKYRTVLDRYGCTKIRAIATSAIRSASNGELFTKTALEQTGIAIEIIDGNREAELIYWGVKLALGEAADESLIMDIGGGSTEFIISSATGIEWKSSFDLGVARLLEKFNPSEPIAAAEITLIETYLKTELAPLFEAVRKSAVQQLIGSSGSFDSFAEIISHRHRQPVDIKKIERYDFELNDYYSVHQDLLSSTRAQRLSIPGLIDMRVDMIVIATIFVKLILRELHIKKMILSTYSLKEGVLYEIYNANKN